jgi:hypothetical protein
VPSGRVRPSGRRPGTADGLEGRAPRLSDSVNSALKTRHAAYLRLAQFPQGSAVFLSLFSPPDDRYRCNRRSRISADGLDLDTTVGKPVDLKGSCLEDAADEIRTAQ